MILYRILGIMFVGLAAIGIFLPLLPTTPLLIVAAGCFAKSSKAWHQWLLNNSVFGPIIHNWEENHCIECRAKIIAIGSILIFGGFSVFYAIPILWVKILTALLLVWGITVVYRIDVCRK